MSPQERRSGYAIANPPESGHSACHVSKRDLMQLSRHGTDEAGLESGRLQGRSDFER